jgi:hypothetical protein
LGFSTTASAFRTGRMEVVVKVREGEDARGASGDEIGDVRTVRMAVAVRDDARDDAELKLETKLWVAAPGDSVGR